MREEKRRLERRDKYRYEREERGGEKGLMRERRRERLERRDGERRDEYRYERVRERVRECECESV